MQRCWRHVMYKHCWICSYGHWPMRGVTCCTENDLAWYIVITNITVRDGHCEVGESRRPYQQNSTKNLYSWGRRTVFREFCCFGCSESWPKKVAWEPADGPWTAAVLQIPWIEFVAKYVNPKTFGAVKALLILRHLALNWFLAKLSLPERRGTNQHLESSIADIKSQWKNEIQMSDFNANLQNPRNSGKARRPAYIYFAFLFLLLVTKSKTRSIKA